MMIGKGHNIIEKSGSGKNPSLLLKIVVLNS